MIQIDGIDASARYKLSVQDGGLAGLILPPPLKSVYTQEWAEENGLDCDLSNPKLDSKEFELKFIFSDKDGEATKKYERFEKDVLNSAYHDFYFSDIDKTFRLRYESTQNLKLLRKPIVTGAGLNDVKYTGLMATIKFCDDFPLKDYTYKAPSIPEAFYKRFQMIDYVSGFDSFKFYRFGAIVLKDSTLDLYKTAEAKTALIRNISILDGKQVLSEFGTKKGKTAKVNLLMEAPSMKMLVDNLNSMIYSLTRSGEHSLTLKQGTGQVSAKVFYRSASVQKFYYVNKIWLQFSLTFQVIN